MVQIKPFEVEQWMDRYENTPEILNIAETCAASVSIDELEGFSTDKNTPSPLSRTLKLTYGHIRGSPTFHKNVASLINNGTPLRTSSPRPPPLEAENVLITQGAIAANFLVFYTLVGPGDHVICVYPTYQQLYDVPQSLGAEVSLWRLKVEDGFIPDVAELERLVKPNTKMIVINNPNNPTGATTPESVLAAIVTFAQARGITILSDEVYSPLYHSLPEGQAAPPSILAFGYDKAVATGSMSKAFALAGIRVGWVATRDRGLIDDLAHARDYTAISVSQLDDQVATYALSRAVLPSLMERNMTLARTNLQLLSSFVEKYSSVCSWVKPTAGTTAFLQFRQNGVPVDDVKFATELVDWKVMFVPAGRCFGGGKDFRGYVRIGYVSHTDVLTAGLENLGRYVEKHLL
ncbi:pyridoxal phosphate-dependent transferase [Cercophora newfieldiana]|uniref:Pyridoxal phosphate-dependent transferase n=1 Tax=Cercophora newfieldiana TaxID=92897 RepID=A0AA39YPI8_9PEZI|nr:pyridoxal phosphate-dependent transferase [Cercophora newfieldiana]